RGGGGGGGAGGRGVVGADVQESRLDGARLGLGGARRSGGVVARGEGGARHEGLDGHDVVAVGGPVAGADDRRAGDGHVVGGQGDVAGARHGQDGIAVERGRGRGRDADVAVDRGDGRAVVERGG